MSSVNEESITLLTTRVQEIINNIDYKYPELVRNMANKISDLDTKIVLKRNTGVPVIDNLVAFV